jgi:hypothetical protein
MEAETPTFFATPLPHNKDLLFKPSHHRKEIKAQKGQIRFVQLAATHNLQ